MNIFFAHITSQLLRYVPVPHASVLLAKHAKGAVASFTTSTDTFTTNRIHSFLYLYMNNSPCTIFEGNGSTTEMLEFYKSGLIDFGVYIDATTRAELLQDPAVFTLLDAKIADAQTANDGISPSCLSYGDGNDDYKDDLYTRFLCGRNSEHDNIGYANGDGAGVPVISPLEFNVLSKEELISRPSTNRPVYYTDSSNNAADELSGTPEMGYNDFYIKTLRALKGGDFYTAFGHWHWYTADDLNTFLGKLREITEGFDVNFAKYSEIGEYYYIKDSVDSVSLSGTTITIDYTKKDVTRPYEKITSWAWILINTAGTSLENDPIQTDIATQIIKKRDNIYAIGFEVNFSNTTQNIVLSVAADESGYNNEAVPIVSVNTGTGLITSDQPINYTLFRKTKAQSTSNATREEFEETFSASHTIVSSIDTVTYDYYLGFGNEFNQFGHLQF